MASTAESGQKGRWVGRPMKRAEDPKLLSGRATFVDDIQIPGMLHAAVLRSPHAHALIKRVDSRDALAHRGVVTIVTGEDAKKVSKPLFNFFLSRAPLEHCIAVDKVRYVGEPVALAVARDRYAAQDAVELINVDYEPLPAVVNAEDAVKPGAPLLHDELERNTVYHDVFAYGDVDKAFEEADCTFEERFVFPRCGGTPMETSGCIASYEPGTGMLTLWANTQLPYSFRTAIAATLSIPRSRVRIIVPDIGGAFGSKVILKHMAYTAVASVKTGRAVKWIETRSEHLMSGVHSPERTYDVRFAATKDGRVLGIRAEMLDNLGAYLNPWQPLPMLRQIYHFVGPYRIDSVEVEMTAVVTNKCPTGAYRGFGIPHAVFVLERCMDIMARALNLDPAEVRMKNFIAPKEFPYTSAVGAIYDSGDYPATLGKALEMVEYEKMRREQDELRRKGRHIGIGIACAVEPGSSAAYPSLITQKARTGLYEGAMVRMESNGEVSVSFSTMPAGTGHETVITQVIADELGVQPGDVTVFFGDTATCPPGTGDFGSRFAVVGVGAALSAARKVKQKLAGIAAHVLDAEPRSIDFADGELRVRGEPERKVQLRRVASIAYNQPHRLPPGMEPGLEEVSIYETPNANIADEKRRVNYSTTYANSAHAAVVEVDPEVGGVKILRYVCVHDCGVMLNPMIVKGQVVGGIAQGIGSALLEEIVYDEEGRLMTGSFMDYLLPKSVDVPDFETASLVTPSPFTELGVKGLGEGGTLASPPAIANAVEDALAPFGARIARLPLKPEAVWKLARRIR